LFIEELAVNSMSSCEGKQRIPVKPSGSPQGDRLPKGGLGEADRGDEGEDFM